MTVEWLASYEWTEHETKHQLRIRQGLEGLQIWHKAGHNAAAPGSVPLELPEHVSRWLWRQLALILGEVKRVDPEAVEQLEIDPLASPTSARS